MYADKITNSMQKTIDETNYRRSKQIAYNTENNIVPKALNKSINNGEKPTSYNVENDSFLLQQIT